MRLEEDLFQRKTPMEQTLIPYGFIQKEDGYHLYRPILDGQFEMDIHIDVKGGIRAVLMDRDTEEEYIQVHMPASTGAYVLRVREAYLEVLEDVARHCFKETVFLFPQANRIHEWIGGTYGEKPDFPFKKSPEAAVYRYPGNRKWYGLVMEIQRGTLFQRDDPTIVEVLNVKVDPDKRNQYLDIDGIYPAYHMNRQNWLSIVLDDTVEDDIVMKMVDESRRFALSAHRKGDTHAWIIPANPKYYDIDKAFRKEKDITWKQQGKLLPGDLVFMYITAPVSAVRYQAVVTETDIPYEFSSPELSMKKIMKLGRTHVYPDDFCPLSKLKELGIKSVRGQRTVTKEFLDYFHTNIEDESA